MLSMFHRTALEQPLLSTFAAIGGLITTYSLYQLTSFVHLHFLRKSSLSRYNQDNEPSWALVTGASDGIGRGFAEELLDRGFNVIIHGRNPEKLERVKATLVKQWPNRDVEILVLDAMVCDQSQLEEAVSTLVSLKITVLINNVAGELHPLFLPHADSSLDRDRRVIHGNFMFATEMTRMLMPHLIKNKPSLILNIGSGSARLPCPYIAMAAASKTFLESFSHTLAVEMIAEGHPEVEVMYNLVGLCSTGSEPRPVTFQVPSSRQFARSSLGLVGCGYRTVWGYWPHALQFEMLFKLPTAVQEQVCINLVSKLKHDYEAKRKT